jgi:hypothetical protein
VRASGNCAHTDGREGAAPAARFEDQPVFAGHELRGEIGLVGEVHRGRRAEHRELELAVAPLGRGEGCKARVVKGGAEGVVGDVERERAAGFEAADAAAQVAIAAGEGDEARAGGRERGRKVAEIGQAWAAGVEAVLDRGDGDGAQGLAVGLGEQHQAAPSLRSGEPA